MWTMILIFFNGYAGGITTIPNFPTEKSCKVAIEQVKVDDHTLNVIGRTLRLGGKCVYVPKEE